MITRTTKLDRPDNLATPFPTSTMNSANRKYIPSQCQERVHYGTFKCSRPVSVQCTERSLQRINLFISELTTMEYYTVRTYTRISGWNKCRCRIIAEMLFESMWKPPTVQLQHYTVMLQDRRTISLPITLIPCSDSILYRLVLYFGVIGLQFLYTIRELVLHTRVFISIATNHAL